MAEQPQIYLSTPPSIELARLADLLPRLLDAAPVACLRLTLATRDQDQVARAADTMRDIAHARDIPVVIDSHYRLVGPLGLDGVHLQDGAKHIREARKELDKEAIVGAFCGASRHDGMTAGEIGADYVSFGPVGASDLLGDGQTADPDLFRWWSQMIELPVVAEGDLTPDQLRLLAPVTDFIGLSSEIWGAEDPVATLRDYHALL